jgi:hypothetical protein
MVAGDRAGIPGLSAHRASGMARAAEMFLNEWSGLAAELGWTADDIFDPPRAGDSGGLAYWLGTDIVTALGPEHAVTETDRVFERN